jgi:3-hydroxyisobutyrate dehydrogenase-like beta-hydroxyacid dehydrogenase
MDRRRSVETIGFLGMGVMGSRMSARLLAAGHEVTVWNRTPEKCRPLVEKGAVVVSTPAEAATGKDVVLSNLTDGPALMSVITGPGGVLEASTLPGLFVDFATIAPAESAEIAAALEARGIGFLRAPVSGTIAVAEAGKLTIITSGDRAVFEAADPVLAVLGPTRYYVGPGENSRYLKLIHQMLIAATMQVWAEGLVMGEKAGLDWEVMLEVLGNSAVGSGVVKGKIPTLAARDYENPAMSLHNIVKDVDLALMAAAGVGVELPATQRVRELYERSLEAGFEWKDYSAVVLDLEKRAGLRPAETAG